MSKFAKGGVKKNLYEAAQILPNAKPSGQARWLLDMLGIVSLELPTSKGLGSRVEFSSFLRSVRGYCNKGNLSSYR